MRIKKQIIEILAKIKYKPVTTASNPPFLSVACNEVSLPTVSFAKGLLFILILSLMITTPNSFAEVSSTPAKPSPIAYESVLGKRKPKTVSEKKIVEIEKIIYTYVQNKHNITDDKVKTMILRKVMKDFPLEKGKKPLQVNMGKLRVKAEKMANDAYPLTTKELEEQLTIKADELYQEMPLNEEITITYTQGPYQKTVSGRYFGLTYYQDGVIIENTVIPIFDMADFDKSRFDSRLRELRKKQYVRDQIEDYEQQKTEFVDTMLRNKLEEAVSMNEKAGFIFEWGKWRTPEDVTELLINYVLDSMKKKEIDSNLSVVTRKPIDSGIADQVPTAQRKKSTQQKTDGQAVSGQ